MLLSAGAAALGKGGLKVIRLVVRQLAKGNIKGAIKFLKRLAKKALKRNAPETPEIPKIKTPIEGISANRKITFDKLDVFQRDELIDPNRLKIQKKRNNHIFALRDNYNRMKEGLAPIGPDGKSMELHHNLQNPDGPIIEMTYTEHKNRFGEIHPDLDKPTRIDRVGQFNNWREAYWKKRAKDFEKLVADNINIERK